MGLCGESTGVSGKLHAQADPRPLQHAMPSAVTVAATCTQLAVKGCRGKAPAGS